MLKCLYRLMLLALAACLLIGFGFAVWFASQQIHAPKNEYHSTQGQNKSNSTANKGESHKSIWERTWEDPTAFFTFWIAIFTLVLAASTIGLWIATILTLSHSRKTAQMQLRAYVMLSGANVRYSDKPNERFVAVEIKNYGQTPANDVVFIVGEHVREWPLKTILPSLDEKSMRRSIAPLPPTSITFHRVPISDLSSWEEGELRAGRAGVYIWGKITYRDIFADRWETEIRLVCEGEGLRTGLMHPTQDGNRYT
jgi:hypothetical protein